MSFSNKCLSVIAYANGFTLWHYAGREAIANIQVDGFFNTVSGLMNKGDMILTNGTDATRILVVTSTDEVVKTVAL